MVLKERGRKRQRVRGERALLKAVAAAPGGLCLIKTNTVIRGGGVKAVILNTNSLPLFTILLLLLLFGSDLHAISVFLLRLLLSAPRPGYRVVGDVLLKTQAYMNTKEHAHQCVCLRS